MSLENGWSNEYSISHSSGMICGDMICDKCGKKIRGYYLIRDRTNFKHRGNETDECYIYHRKCRDNKVWDEFDKKRKADEAERKVYESHIKEVKGLISKYKICLSDLSIQE